MKKNIILDKLPQFTPTGLKIRTNFRESIKFELLMQNNNIKILDKLSIAINLFYYKIPNNIDNAINDILWFYKGGNELTTSQEYEKKEYKQVYSYEFDAEYIYSAFIQEYKIDLNNIKYLHWWKFKSLMDNLSDNTQFVKIMGYRTINLNNIKDKEEKARYKKLKKLYALPDMRTKEQKEADFGRAFW